MFRGNGHDEVAILERETTRGRTSGKSSGRRGRRRGTRMRRFLRENGLSLAAFGIFLICLVGQAVTGLHEYNADQREHGQPTVGAAQYLRSGHFIEVTFENWESEFLQMAAFVALTAILRQKGSPESKKLEGEEEVDEDPREALRSPQKRAKAPWPVRRGGLVLKLYAHSLSIALLLLFVASFVFHALGGASRYNEEQLAHGGSAMSTLAYIGTSRFWFESFQNWQSEFLAVFAIIWLSIYLRQRGSPESKPVMEPHGSTGKS
jgi:uncharacterized protein DUF6766